MPAGRPATQPRTDFGKRLYQARLEKGFSQKHMAELLELTQQSYAAWERKPTALKPEQLVALSQALETSIDSLLGISSKAKGHSGPVGKMQRLFEEASKLPRHQQNKASEFLEGFLMLQEAKAS